MSRFTCGAARELKEGRNDVGEAGVSGRLAVVTRGQTGLLGEYQ